jgi:hypothetical protein
MTSPPLAGIQASNTTLPKLTARGDQDDDCACGYYRPTTCMPPGERPLARVLFESREYFAFKQTLIQHPSDPITACLLTLAVFATIPFIDASWDAAASSHRVAVTVTDASLLVCAELLFLALVVTRCVAGRLDAAGRWGWFHAHAHRFHASPWFSRLVGATCVVGTVRMGLQLLWYSELNPCVAPPPLTATLPSCNPAGMSLPSDRLALALALPVLVLVFLPGLRLCVAFASWTVVCVCMCVFYARKGALVESYQALNAACFLYILIKVDAFMWAAHRLHCTTADEAARTLALEVALADSKRQAAESTTAELRALMGNVAHDLKTPILAITMSIDLLRYFVRAV